MVRRCPAAPATTCSRPAGTPPRCAVSPATIPTSSPTRQRRSSRPRQRHRRGARLDGLRAVRQCREPLPDRRCRQRQRNRQWACQHRLRQCRRQCHQRRPRQRHSLRRRRAATPSSSRAATAPTSSRISPGAADGDIVRLADHGFSTFDEVRSAMTEVGNDTYLAVRAFETLVFRDAGIDRLQRRISTSRRPARKPGLDPRQYRYGQRRHHAGSASNERFEGKGEADIFKGGVGDDTYLVDNAEQVRRRALREGIDTVESYISFALPDNVENLDAAGARRDRASAIPSPTGWSARPAADTLNGKAGNDWLFGGRARYVRLRGRRRQRHGRRFTAPPPGSPNATSCDSSAIGENAYLSQAGDDWTIHFHEGGDVSLHLAGVTALSRTTTYSPEAGATAGSE